MEKSCKTPKYTLNFAVKCVKALHKTYSRPAYILRVLYKYSELQIFKMFQVNQNRYYHYRKMVKFMDFLVKLNDIEVREVYNPVVAEWMKENCSKFKDSGYSINFIRGIAHLRSLDTTHPVPPVPQL